MKGYSLHLRVLVTGGSGFPGLPSCDRLIAEGGDGLCVDSFFASARDSIVHLIGTPRCEPLRHDIACPLVGGRLDISRPHWGGPTRWHNTQSRVDQPKSTA